ncbi:hypothetical protein E2C01_047805 [Portunus trituberculatus]|uniref:Uncharacterized protein n=1 Tax=Portunus trituberculatus TaxID=210409 RepID=A0A5B7G4J9_PORTR|nr:hypothetical protein [Portunus trituberculatus]
MIHEARLKRDMVTSVTRRRQAPADAHPPGASSLVRLARVARRWNVLEKLPEGVTILELPPDELEDR